MKIFCKCPHIAVLFCLLVITNSYSQSGANTTAEVKPSITFNVKPNKLDKDGGQVVINQGTIAKGLGLLKNRRKQREQERENTIQSSPAPTNGLCPEMATTSPVPSEPATTVPTLVPVVDASYGGEWKMAVTIQEKYTNSGQRLDAPGNCEIGMKLKIEGQRLTGEYTWAKGVCGIAKIEGTMTDDNTFEAIIAYSGGCCGGAKMKFTGAFLSTNSISGKFKPEGLPGSWCETWWATVKGERE